MENKIKTNSFEELNVSKNAHDFDVKTSNFNILSSNFSINSLLPQQPPFVMVEKLLFCDIEKTKTSLLIKSDNIFVEPMCHCGLDPQSLKTSDSDFRQNDSILVLSQSGIIENVAQTCAARMGYLGDRENVKIGMIGSINDFEFTGFLPKIDDEIITEIVVDTEIGNVVLLNATVVCNEKIVAKGKMKVVLTDKNVHELHEFTRKK